MKTILDDATRQEIIDRIDKLDGNSAGQWGKMTPYQMVKHCRLWEQMILSNKPEPRVFVGRIFGTIILKAILKDDAPLRRNSPTVPAMVITGDGDIVAEKADWITLIKTYPEQAPAEFIHPFFGKMNREQLGLLAYKHADHHLRQFGC